MRGFQRVIVLILISFIINFSSVKAASEFRQRHLISKYIRLEEIYWDELTRHNRDLIDNHLWEMVKNYYNQIIKDATIKAEKNKTMRQIPSIAYPYASLADYIAKKLGKRGDLRYKLALEHLEDGRLDTAASICNIILAEDPKNVKVAELQAELFLKMNMPKEAMERYLQILKYDRNNKIALYRLGVMYIHLNQYKNANKMFKRLLKVDPNNKEARRFVDLYEGNITSISKKKIDDTAIHHYMLAERYFEAGKYRDAAEEYSLAIEQDPEFYKAYVYLGECLTRLKKYPQSIEVLKQAIQLAPNLPEAYYYLGLSYEKQYNFNPKTEFLKKAIENYKTALAKKKDYEQAKKSLKRVQERLARETKN